MPDLLPLLTFLALLSLTLIALLVTNLYTRRRVEARLATLGAEHGVEPPAGLIAKVSQAALPKLAQPLVPGKREEQSQLQTRLMWAGLYSRNALPYFLGVKMMLIIVPVLIGLAVGLLQYVPILYGLAGGIAGSALGIVVPGLWLDWRKANRQSRLRASMPDVIDVIVLCVDGGLSVQAAVQRVHGEFESIYPLLASELLIVQREMQLGQSAGEALQHFAERCDLEEIRSLSSVILQSEQLGTSINKALRLHAEALRDRRLHEAEELAYKAATKIVFPTVLCIFPAMIYVAAGPAYYQIRDLFAQIGR